MFAIPNGGARTPATGAMLKREGVKAGVPDICLPCARHGWHSLYIELKLPSNRPRPHQAAWLNALTQAGHLAVTCWSWLEAKEVIEKYLS